MKIETLILVALAAGIVIAATSSTSSASPAGSKLPGWKISASCTEAELVDIDLAAEDLDRWLEAEGYKGVQVANRFEAEQRLRKYFQRHPDCTEPPGMIRAGSDTITWSEFVDWGSSFGGPEGVIVEPEPDGARVELDSRDGLQLFAELIRGELA